MDDIFQIREEDSSRVVCDQLEHIWQEEVGVFCFVELHFLYKKLEYPHDLKSFIDFTYFLG